MATTKYTTQKNIMTDAHRIAKTLDTTIVYAKRLGQAIKMAWTKIKAVFSTVLVSQNKNMENQIISRNFENNQPIVTDVSKYVEELTVPLSKIRLRTFGGWKNEDMPTAKEVAEHIIDEISDGFRQEKILKQVIEFYKKVAENKNIVMWKYKGCNDWNTERLMTRNPLHFVLCAVQEEIDIEYYGDGNGEIILKKNK